MATEKNYLFELPNYALVSVIGDKAQEFLQGQLTCDLRQVSDNVMRQGALCNLKGRVLALMNIVRWQQHYLLVLPHTLVEDTLRSLSKAAVLSRVRLSLTTDYHLFGFQLGSADNLLPFSAPCPARPYESLATEEGVIYNLKDGFYQIIVPKHAVDKLSTPFNAQEQLLGLSQWQERQLARLQVEIYPETRGQFLAHRLDLHKTSYISFDKGCYKGQEIIARTQYLGKLKYELQTAILPYSTQVQRGMKVLDPETKAEIGELIDFCLLDNGQCRVVVSILKGLNITTQSSLLP